MSQFIRKLIFCTVALSLNPHITFGQQPPPPPPPPPATMRAIPLPENRPLVRPPLRPPQAAPAQPPAAVVPVQPTNASSAKIQFASTIYDFGKVQSGDAVKFSFLFTNVGTQLLEITGVQPQCGCTAAGEWTKRVEPGQTGVVPLQFNTANYHGQVFKTITVSCNDPTQAHVLLQLKGNIWKPIDLIPPYTVMNILPDMTAAAATVRITNNMEQPIEIMSPICSAKGFSAELKTNSPGREYQLTLTAMLPLNPGTTSGKVTVKTSATNTPTLDIPFWANVQAPVMLLPPQVMLPAGPLKGKHISNVTVQNNTTNALVVSEPRITEAGVDVTLKELQPGRIFSFQLNFPEGFELKAGHQAALTFKTSHPQLSELRVPIFQITQAVVPSIAAPQVQPVRSKVQSANRVVTPAKTLVPQPPAAAQ